MGGPLHLTVHIPRDACSVSRISKRNRKLLPTKKWKTY